MIYKFLGIFLSLILVTSCESSDLIDPSTMVPFYLQEDSYVEFHLINHYDVEVTSFKRNFGKGQNQVMISMDILPEGAYTLQIEATGKYTNTYTKTSISIILVKR